MVYVDKKWQVFFLVFFLCRKSMHFKRTEGFLVPMVEIAPFCFSSFIAVVVKNSR